jgi:hypothetical protein
MLDDELEATYVDHSSALPPTMPEGPRYRLAKLRKATGHGDAAILLNQVLYWSDKAMVVIPSTGSKPWIAKTIQQWADELGMAYRTLRTAHAHLLKLKLIESRTAKFHDYKMLHIRPTDAAEMIII